MSGPNSLRPSGGLVALENSGGYAIQPLGPSPMGGDMHETFRANEGGLSDGHTTVRIPGGQEIHLPWPK